MLLIAFEDGYRPSIADVLSVGSKDDRISLSNSPENPELSNWAELLIDGMTFDVTGLGSGADLHVPRPRNFHGSIAQVRWPDAQVNAISIALGPHLAEANPNLPIARGLAKLGAILSSALDNVLCLVWAPAELAIDRAAYALTVDDWVDAGNFPSPIFIGTKNMPDDGVQSVGLTFFIGQEIRIEPEHFDDSNSAHRLARRLIEQFVLSGPVLKPDQIIGPDGTPLRIVPSGNGKFIRVSKG